MTEKEYQRKKYYELFRHSLSTASLIGAVIFLGLSFLDAIATPENFPRFLIYRFIAAAVLLLSHYGVKRYPHAGVHYALAYASVLVSAGMIELMILDFGGHESHYYVGMILLQIVTLSFMPAPMGFHFTHSLATYTIYLVPIIATEDITDFRTFFISNFFLLAIVSTGLVLRAISNRSLEKQFSLNYELEIYQHNLEMLVDDRTAELNKALDQVRKSSKEWETTFDSTRDSILLLNREMKVVRGNSSASYLFGKTFREMIGVPIRDLFSFHEEGKKALMLRKMDNPQSPFAEEIYDASRDRWFWVTADPITGAQDFDLGSIVTVRDITEIKRLQDSITQSKALWEETFNTINEAITIHDRDYNIILANKAAEEMLGRSPKEIASLKCFQSYHGTGCPPENCPSCGTLKTGIASTAELYEPNLSKHIEIKAIPRNDRDGRNIGIIHIVRDISERKRAEEQLMSVHRMMMTIFEKAPFGIFVVTEQGRVEYVNPAMLRISGSSHEYFWGVNAFELPTYKELGISHLLKRALEGEPFSLGPVDYTSYFGKKPSTRNFIGIPLKEERKVLVFVEDITNLKKMEREREAFYTQLLQAQKLESIGRLAGGFAHDFNNLLSVIIGYCDRLLRLLPADSPEREDIQIISDAGEKGAGLTRQLLAFSRKQVLEVKAVNLNTIVANMGKMLHRSIGEDIFLKMKTAKPVKAIMADPGQIEQIIMNLSLNARDAMPEGGLLTIETADTTVCADDSLMQNNLAPGDYVVLKVTDTGMGIPDDIRALIFEPFFTTKEKGKGTGLGLSTVYGIVSQHNGRITVVSEAGKGTTFAVYFPAAEERAESPRAREAMSLKGGEETILLVEDDEMIRTMIAGTLRSLGYPVLEARDGKEALQVLKNTAGSVHLILTDIVMPHISGVKLAEEVKKRWPDIKIVFMSGYTDELTSEKGLDKDIHFIRKPVTGSSAASKVREVLDSISIV